MDLSKPTNSLLDTAFGVARAIQLFHTRRELQQYHWWMILVRRELFDMRVEIYRIEPLEVSVIIRNNPVLGSRHTPRELRF